VIVTLVGLALAIVGACMWAENVKKRKAREASEDSQAEDHRQ
jgi:hypothetical protein